MTNSQSEQGGKCKFQFPITTVIGSLQAASSMLLLRPRRISFDCWLLPSWSVVLLGAYKYPTSGKTWYAKPLTLHYHSVIIPRVIESNNRRNNAK